MTQVDNSNSQLLHSIILSKTIPTGTRIVVRTQRICENQTCEDPTCESNKNVTISPKIEYYDIIAHVLEWDGKILHILRDPAANGSRAAEEMFVDAKSIVRLKPIPERKIQKPLRINNR